MRTWPGTPHRSGLDRATVATVNDDQVPITNNATVRTLDDDGRDVSNPIDMVEQPGLPIEEAAVDEEVVLDPRERKGELVLVTRHLWFGQTAALANVDAGAAAALETVGAKRQERRPSHKRPQTSVGLTALRRREIARAILPARPRSRRLDPLGLVRPHQPLAVGPARTIIAGTPGRMRKPRPPTIIVRRTA